MDMASDVQHTPAAPDAAPLGDQWHDYILSLKKYLLGLASRSVINQTGEITNLIVSILIAPLPLFVGEVCF